MKILAGIVIVLGSLVGCNGLPNVEIEGCFMRGGKWICASVDLGADKPKIKVEVDKDHDHTEHDH